MKHPIGFAPGCGDKDPSLQTHHVTQHTPVKSLVQVHFPSKNQTLTYFNDRFDLYPGDLVFVEGKLEGIRGVIRTVTKNFKIKVADYKKVVSVADTRVSGPMYFAGSHFVAFRESVLP